MRTVIAGLIGAVALAATTASAITIDYTVAGWGPVTLANQGQPGDRIALLEYLGSLDLQANVPAVAKINTLTFDVNYTWPSGQFQLEVERDITVAMVTDGIVQSGTFDSWFINNQYDSVWLDAGTTLTLDLGANGFLDVTPLASSLMFVGNGHHETDVNATFVWRPVPDVAVTAMLLGMGMLSLGCVRRWVK